MPHPLTRALLEWYGANARDLPWRQTGDPYAIWVSEIMLQQTRVEAVIPYYARWMQRFPGIRSLAEASQQEVLAVWEGLGYYARARQLHKAAREVVAHHGGRLPSQPDDIIHLPGIGRYTAAAIAAIAFVRPVPSGLGLPGARPGACGSATGARREGQAPASRGDRRRAPPERKGVDRSPSRGQAPGRALGVPRWQAGEGREPGGLPEARAARGTGRRGSGGEGGGRHRSRVQPFPRDRPRLRVHDPAGQPAGDRIGRASLGDAPGTGRLSHGEGKPGDCPDAPRKCSLGFCKSAPLIAE